MEFERSRKVLAARRKQLTQLGLGNKPNATRPLEDSEVEKLKEIGYFRWENSEQLQRLMWWCITTQFGYRARDESRKLCFGDIVLCRDSDGQRYLEWDTERGSKTRTGEKMSSHQRAFNPKAYETGSWDCPVATYTKNFANTAQQMQKCQTHHSFLLLSNHHKQRMIFGSSRVLLGKTSLENF